MPRPDVAGSILKNQPGDRRGHIVNIRRAKFPTRGPNSGFDSDCLYVPLLRRAAATNQLPSRATGRDFLVGVIVVNRDTYSVRERTRTPRGGVLATRARFSLFDGHLLLVLSSPLALARLGAFGSLVPLFLRIPAAPIISTLLFSQRRYISPPPPSFFLLFISFILFS